MRSQSKLIHHLKALPVISPRAPSPQMNYNTNVLTHGTETMFNTVLPGSQIQLQTPSQQGFYNLTEKRKSTEFSVCLFVAHFLRSKDSHLLLKKEYDTICVQNNTFFFFVKGNSLHHFIAFCYRSSAKSITYFQMGRQLLTCLGTG